MNHRHLIDSHSLSLAAIDDIIGRGGRAEWAFLRDMSRSDSDVMSRIRKVCAAHMGDPFDQKYIFWRLYAK